MDGTLMFHVKLVVAKSALLRFPLRGKLHTLPCSSSPHATRFAGLARGPFYFSTVSGFFVKNSFAKAT